MTLRFILPASLILTIGFPASLEAREPFFGDYRGKTSRTADHAKPKRLKVPAKAVCRQNGPSTYDSRATVTANGNGEN